ncbi:hypothetical protein NE237_004984 [Protea cynaroides]|uniref:Uncharacterized protein n=1 Tax=Protea cynaroides TaxID=273540 RepID=A0A9Q0KK06_9MAGN|nr:hypothetical protein NE237_004984 [Protea cynaroides]
MRIAGTLAQLERAVYPVCSCAAYHGSQFQNEHQEGSKAIDVTGPNGADIQGSRKSDGYGGGGGRSSRGEGMVLEAVVGVIVMEVMVVDTGITTPAPAPAPLQAPADLGTDSFFVL